MTVFDMGEMGPLLTRYSVPLLQASRVSAAERRSIVMEEPARALARRIRLAMDVSLLLSDGKRYALQRLGILSCELRQAL